MDKNITEKAVKENEKASMLHGVLLIALFSFAAFYIGDIPVIKALSLSPLVIGIILGMLYANSLRSHLPATWVPGIQFSSKKLLRLGIILYGFRLSFQDVAAVGTAGIVVDAIIVTLTIFIGVFLTRLLKMDKELGLLTSIGSAICGAAAVLGAEAAIKTQPYKTAVAVATVVIFGTLSMFLYPIAYRAGIIPLTPEEMGIYSGATLHEVAHAVGAGNAMGSDIGSIAIIVKMIRVMMLVPVLLVLGWMVSKGKFGKQDGQKGKVQIPWFAIWFLVMIAVNSIIPIPESVLSVIEYIDTFLLTMAMTALGAETSIDKFRKAGAKPFMLAGMLYIWLIFGGFALAKYLVPVLL